jgi:hypothetical protein
MATETKYFVVPAPGHYGDATHVLSSHATREAARKAAGSGYVVREGALRKGARFVRADEAHHPVA